MAEKVCPLCQGRKQVLRQKRDSEGNLVLDSRGKCSLAYVPCEQCFGEGIIPVHENDPEGL